MKQTIAIVHYNTPALWCRNWRNLEDIFEHFGAASYREDKAEQQQAWLEQHRALWE